MMSHFDPKNNIVTLCMQGMGMEDQGKPEDANNIFLRAWHESTDDYERFLASYFVARHQETPQDRLKWLEKSLAFALMRDDEALRSALPTLYSNIAKCHEALHEFEKANLIHELSKSYQVPPSSKGPFYHGTKADLQIGDLLTAGGESNYKTELKMNHIYFTALLNGAGLAAALAKGDGRERVYIVEPTGGFENDPNVTDKKFPGNLTRSYRSQEPLKIVGEVKDWARQTPEEVRQWKEKLAHNKGEIID